LQGTLLYFQDYQGCQDSQDCQTVRTQAVSGLFLNYTASNLYIEYCTLKLNDASVSWLTNLKTRDHIQYFDSIFVMEVDVWRLVVGVFALNRRSSVAWMLCGVARPFNLGPRQNRLSSCLLSCPLSLTSRLLPFVRITEYAITLFALDG
jgi:hypothetical protein